MPILQQSTTYLERALEETWKMWQWLTNNSYITTKHDVPSHLKPSSYLGGLAINLCSCCEFVNNHTAIETKNNFPCGNTDKDELKEFYHYSLESGRRQIQLCPLKSLWPQGCEHSSSPYTMWQEAEDEKERKEAAQQIADAALRLLTELRASKAQPTPSTGSSSCAGGIAE
jgi:hypothetical protein